MFAHTKRRIAFVTLMCLLLGSLIISCVSAPPHEREATSSLGSARGTESSQHVKAMNESILMRTLTTENDPYRDYKIGPEDLLEISVFEVEKLNKTVRVSFQGEISLPLLGTLQAKGLTARELEVKIRYLLAEKYLQDPHVTVFLKEYHSQRISVIGAVKEPAVFEVTGQKTILDMLAMAGGLKDDAGNTLFLIRPSRSEEKTPEAAQDSEGGGPRTFVINLEELLIEGDLTLNLPLMNGDVINIPVSDKVFVGGEVWRPGGFLLKAKKMTLSQAVVLAGGLKPQAKGSHTRIFRYSRTGTGREIITANIYDIQKGKREDIYLENNDIVIVPKHGAKAFLVGVKETLTGVFSVGYALGSL